MVADPARGRMRNRAIGKTYAITYQIVHTNMQLLGKRNIRSDNNYWLYVSVHGALDPFWGLVEGGGVARTNAQRI